MKWSEPSTRRLCMLPMNQGSKKDENVTMMVTSVIGEGGDSPVGSDTDEGAFDTVDMFINVSVGESSPLGDERTTS